MPATPRRRAERPTESSRIRGRERIVRTGGLRRDLDRVRGSQGRELASPLLPDMDIHDVGMKPGDDRAKAIDAAQLKHADRLRLAAVRQLVHPSGEEAHENAPGPVSRPRGVAFARASVESIPADPVPDRSGGDQSGS